MYIIQFDFRNLGFCIKAMSRPTRSTNIEKTSIMYIQFDFGNLRFCIKLMPTLIRSTNVGFQLIHFCVLPGSVLFLKTNIVEVVKFQTLGAFQTFLDPPKTYVVGTQKNCLDEMVLLSTQNICLN